MRYLIGFVCVCVLGLVPMVGCSSGNGKCQSDGDCNDGRECSEDYCSDGACGHNLVRCPCEAALSDYCTGDECPTRDQAIVDALESCPTVWLAEAGRCGEGNDIFDYVDSQSSYQSETQYFDTTGTLVAVTECTDCDCFFCSDGRRALCINYGPVPDCERRPDKVLCGGSCEFPLSDYCTAPECPTWDQAIADVRQSCDAWRYAATWQCGDYRYVEALPPTNAAFQGLYQYFDASGALVAVRWCLDHNGMECGPDHFARCNQYGPMLDCGTPVREEVLCELR